MKRVRVAELIGSAVLMTKRARGTSWFEVTVVGFGGELKVIWGLRAGLVVALKQRWENAGQLGPLFSVGVSGLFGLGLGC